MECGDGRLCGGQHRKGMESQIGDRCVADLVHERACHTLEPHAHPGVCVRSIHESGAAAQDLEIAQRLPHIAKTVSFEEGPGGGFRQHAVEQFADIEGRRRPVDMHHGIEHRPHVAAMCLDGGQQFRS